MKFGQSTKDPLLFQMTSSPNSTLGSFGKKKIYSKKTHRAENTTLCLKPCKWSLLEIA